MKTLKFRDHLVPLVLSGEKNSTWRLFDDKNLSVGDEILLQEFEKDEPFAKGVITKTTEKRFGDLTDDDKRGHETYANDEEMYRTYTGYYKTSVTRDTTVKIIWFSLKN